MAIVLGGDGIDALLTVGPSITADGLVFHIDAANADSILTKGGIPLADGVEVDYMYGLVGDGQLVTFTSRQVGFPYYKADKGGYLYVGANGDQNIKGTLSNEVVLGNTYTLDIWVSPRKSSNDYGINWLTGQDLIPPINGGGRSMLVTITAAGIDTYGYSSLTRAIPQNIWTNVTIAITPGQANYYVNGIPRGIGPKNITKQIDTRLQFIGSSVYPEGGGDTSLGPTKVYNRALTAPEILQNYNATKGRYTL